MFREIFEAMAYEGAEARIRARVRYYHQVGYQVMRVEESIEERLRNHPYYTEILTGIPRTERS